MWWVLVITPPSRGVSFDLLNRSMNNTIYSSQYVSNIHDLFGWFFRGQCGPSNNTRFWASALLLMAPASFTRKLSWRPCAVMVAYNVLKVHLEVLWSKECQKSPLRGIFASPDCNTPIGFPAVAFLAFGLYQLAPRFPGLNHQAFRSPSRSLPGRQNLPTFPGVGSWEACILCTLWPLK